MKKGTKSTNVSVVVLCLMMDMYYMLKKKSPPPAFHPSGSHSSYAVDFGQTSCSLAVSWPYLSSAKSKNERPDWKR